jgi:CRISPR-associated protein Csy1
MEHTGMSKKIADYILGRAQPKLEDFDKNAEKERKKIQETEALNEFELALSAKRQKLEEKFFPVNWLTDAADRAKQRQLVTHALKFTHSDAKGSSYYAPGGDQQSKNTQQREIVSTATLTKLSIDSVGNAAALDVAALLQLEHDGKTLIEYIRNKDATPLQPFALSEEQLLNWLDGFGQVLLDGKPSSHKLAKQLYFPIGDGKYHLISPLYPSSLAHAVYERIASSRFSEEAKQIRKDKRETKYNKAVLIDYPDTALQTFGGTKPQNVSQLNSRRGGKSFLLNCGPPHWRSQNKPPLGIKTIFSQNHFSLRVRNEIWMLRDFLNRRSDENRTFAVRNKRADLIDKLIDSLFQYGAEIQNLKEWAGWSAAPECKLARAEQLWLDPRRGESDEVFAQEREKNDWQKSIANQFAFWLNSRIKSKKIIPGDVEHREWKSLLEQRISLLREDLEVLT